MRFGLLFTVRKNEHMFGIQYLVKNNVKDMHVVLLCHIPSIRLTAR